MKFYLRVLLALLLGVAPFSACFAASPQFWAVDTLRDRTELVDAGQNKASIIEIGNKPMKLKPQKSTNGYWLLCQGSAKLLGGVAAPGTFIALNRDLHPVGTPITLPGLVVREQYLEEQGLWLAVTTQDKEVTLNVLELDTTRYHQIKLPEIPGFYQLSPDGNQLAVTVNVPGDQTASLIILIDLQKFETKSFSTGINSGAVYFINPNQIIVASGGFRDSQKYPAKWKIQTAGKLVPAQLQIINTQSGQSESISVGYSPVAIVQDQKQPDTFYCVGFDNSSADGTRSTFRIIQNGKVINKLELADEILRIEPTPSGNLCLLGQVRFYLIDPKTAKVLTEITTELRINTVRFSADGHNGYLFITNSSKIPVIDLQNGKQLATIKINRNNLLDAFKSLNLGGGLFAAAAPPVTGTNPAFENKIENSPLNERLLFCPEQNRLFVLTGSDKISVINLKTNQVERTIKLNGAASGFHLIPGSNRLMAATDYSWDLIDPEKTTPILSVKISREEESASLGYYNSDGTRLVVPFKNQLYLIDTQKPQFIGKIHTKSEQPLIIWP
ncbi:MAG TPA: hypothetical protein VEC37_11820 [Bacillota bacterium]|nr:hypothetical protein [Bacillota bacterium]